MANIGTDRNTKEIGYRQTRKHNGDRTRFFSFGNEIQKQKKHCAGTHTYFSVSSDGRSATRRYAVQFAVCFSAGSFGMRRRCTHDPLCGKKKRIRLARNVVIGAGNISG